MAKRHAQLHWLKVQAAEAVKLAMEMPEDVANCTFDSINELTEGERFDKVHCEMKRLDMLALAADYLVAAEFYHRVAVRVEGP